MPIRAVIFDLMDELLLVEDRGVWHTWEASAGVAEGGLARAMFRSPQFPEAISGHVPEAVLWRDGADTLGVDAAPAGLAAVFYSAFRVNTGLVEFLRTLRPRYQRQFGISDTQFTCSGQVQRGSHYFRHTLERPFS